MSTRVRAPEGTDFPLAPEGLHQAVCADVWDVWTEPRPEDFGGGIVDKTRLVWELEAEDKATGKRYQVSGIYTASLHPKAKLSQHLESWRGRQFTEEERKGFELETVVGVNCQIQVVHHLSGKGKTFANVQAIVPMGKGMTKMRVSEGFIRKKDRKKISDSIAPSDADDNVPF